jgi:nicotinate-nucleotide adenylyltransferase
MARLGIFGGTFDPPHLAHLMLADEAQSQLGLDRVLWVLTPEPPHKRSQSITSLADRLDMVLATIVGNPTFELCRVDIDRPPPYYAVDTVRLLRESFPQDGLIYLMGGDSLYDLPRWHAPREFLARCEALGVARRSGNQVDFARLEDTLPGIRAKVLFVEVPQLEISSSEIRRRVMAALPYRYFLVEKVAEIIRQRKLYLAD